MTRTTRARRAATALLVPLLLAVLAPFAPTAARAQTSTATIALRSQTPWTTTEDATVRITVAIGNTGDAPLTDLALVVQVRSAIGSRTAYEGSLRADAGRVLSTETFAQPQALAPGETRTATIAIDLSTSGIDTGDSGIYPLRIALTSGGDELAVLRTPAVHLVREPLEPLGLVWTVVLSSPIRFAPKGAFLGDALAEDLRPAGRLGGAISALQAFAAQPSGRNELDLILAPTLLLQLDRMARGYAVQRSDDPYDVVAVPKGEGGADLAARALATLADVAASGRVRLGIMPYGGASLPALIASDLPGDVNAQLDAATDVVEELLGVRPDPTVVRPTGSAIDAASLEALAKRRVRAVVLDPSAVVVPEQPLGFAAPAEFPLAAGESRVAALVSNDALAALIDDPTLAGDPALLAQATLGELAAIWQEAPGTPRTIAIGITESVLLPGAFYAPFLVGVGGAPWIRTTSVASIAADVGDDDPAELVPSLTTAFPADYVQRIREVRHRIDVYETMLVEDSDEPARLRRILLLAQSAEFLDDPGRGSGFIDQADGDVSAMLQSVRLLAGQQITLTSARGAIVPLRIENAATEPLRATIRLVSQHLLAPVEQDLVWEPGETKTLTFPVDLKTSGRFPLQVQVVAPEGNVVSTATLFVRSTELNRQALAIVIGAGVLLVLLWARRFLPSRRRRADA